jgi:vacuolar-type H+-ATPase subunit I/STV1
MIYSKFITKTEKYLKSVRILKNYVTFDLIFPPNWVMVKNAPEGIEIIQNEDQENKITSFVCLCNSQLIDKLENVVDTVTKTNIEREEKEKLFKSKVQELRNIFEKEKLESLKSLKFDVEELTSLLQNEQDNNKIGEGVQSVK